MKTHTLLFKLNLGLALGLLGGFAPPAAVAGDTTFTYQACLTVDGLIGPNSRYDFRFKLFDAETGGNQVGPAATAGPFGGYVAQEHLPCDQGSVLFTVPLNFGTDAFLPSPPDGTPSRWLEIAVRTATNNPATPYTLLSPRQAITPAPQALYAAMAGTVPAGSLTSTQLAPGAVMTLNLEDGAVTSPKIAPGNVLRSLNGLKDDVTLSAGEGLAVSTVGNDIRFQVVPGCDATYSNCFWNLRGNGNILAGAHFLGTVAGELDPLELRVNDNRTMLYTFTGPNDSPNIAGGYKGNVVSGTGGTIGGGGRLTGINKVSGLYGTVGGGFTNVIEFAASSTIAGGEANTIQHDVTAGTIGGGSGNTLYPMSYSPTIGGGMGNAIEAGQSGTIGGGEVNRVGGTSGTIGGGRQNNVAAGEATVSGGAENVVQMGASAATVSGGQKNVIGTNSPYSTIGGGTENHIERDVTAATVSGGGLNRIGTNADYSTISGGTANRIDPNALAAAIGGGTNNLVQTSASYATLGGGRDNWVGMNATYATIGGGSDNSVRNGASYSTVAGGLQNTISTNTAYASVGGGINNFIHTNGDYSTIAGGNANSIRPNANSSAIGGGNGNTISTNADYGTIGGGSGNSIETNVNYATIPGGYRAEATLYGQMAHASGRFANNGDAQSSSFVLRTNTTSTVQAELFLDGLSQRLRVPSGGTWAVEVLVVARSSTGQSAGYRTSVVIENIAGAAAFVPVAASVNVPPMGEDVAGWTVTLEPVGDALAIKVVTPETPAPNVRWVASVRTAEVIY